MTVSWDVVYAAVVWACWGLFCLVWAVGGLHNPLRAPPVKQRRDGLSAWLVAIALIVAGRTFVPQQLWAELTFDAAPLRVIGVAVLLVSTLFTLWGRLSLGTMWTSSAVIRLDHQLRTTGPYAITRHPIYTGVLGMLAGTMLMSGFGVWLFYFLAAVVVLKTKVSSEERLLEETFGERYREYQRRVPQLVPGLGRFRASKQEVRTGMSRRSRSDDGDGVPAWKPSKPRKDKEAITMRPLLRIVQRHWFQTLVSGLVLFYGVQRVLIGTENPNFVPTLLLLGAFLTPVVFVTYVYERQPVRSVPLASVAVCFFWGGAVGTVLAGLLEYETLRSLGPLTLVGVGLIEETAKLVLPLAIFLRGRYRLQSDGLLFGVAAGMGFAALETMGYGFVALLGSGGNLAALDVTLLVRGLLAPAGHAAWTGLVCAVAWRERQHAGHLVLNGAMLGAFLAAVVLHGLWDAFNLIAAAEARFPRIELIAQLLSLAIALMSLSLLIRRLREARGLDRVQEAPQDRSPREPIGSTLVSGHAGHA